MKELDSFQKQLAREEDSLAAIERRIDSARQRIESLTQQIEASKREIRSTEELIEKLRANGETIDKRKSLLLQYIELAKAGNDTDLTQTQAQRDERPEPAVEASPSRDEVRERAVQASPSGDEASGVEKHLAPVESIDDEDASGDLPYLETDDDQDLDDLPFVEPLDSEADLDDGAGPLTVSLDDIDEVAFTHEILPHTQTFGEELLLVLAYHRKATAPKSVVRIFRRLDYAPKQPATEKNVTALVELNPHLYQYAAGGRIALTREGRNEALRLLAELY